MKNSASLTARFVWTFITRSLDTTKIIMYACGYGLLAMGLIMIATNQSFLLDQLTAGTLTPVLTYVAVGTAALSVLSGFVQAVAVTYRHEEDRPVYRYRTTSAG